MPHRKRKRTEAPTLEINPYTRSRLAPSTTLKLLPMGGDPFASKSKPKPKAKKAAFKAGLGPNWDNLKEKLSTKRQKTIKRDVLSDLGDVVGIDCEMVGAGVEGERSQLARVAVIDHAGTVLIDTYVQPMELVTDYRTHVSGIRPGDLKEASRGGAAQPFSVVQKAVADILKDRIVVGHSIRHDLRALILDHPKNLIRDTAKYRPLMRVKKSGKYASRSLKELAAEILSSGEHSPVEDARAAMAVYQEVKDKWEEESS